MELAANVDGAVARLNGFRADAVTYQRQVQQGLHWTAATGKLQPAPPDESVAHHEATDFTADGSTSMWARYNSGRRYHDWDPNTKAWVRQPSDSTGVTVYAPAPGDAPARRLRRPPARLVSATTPTNALSVVAGEVVVLLDPVRRILVDRSPPHELMRLLAPRAGRFRASAASTSTR